MAPDLLVAEAGTRVSPDSRLQAGSSQGSVVLCPCFHALHLLAGPHPFSRASPSRNSPLAPYALIPVPPGFAGSESRPRVRSGQTRTWAASQDLPTLLCRLLPPSPPPPPQPLLSAASRVLVYTRLMPPSESFSGSSDLSKVTQSLNRHGDPLRSDPAYLSSPDPSPSLIHGPVP